MSFAEESKPQNSTIGTNLDVRPTTTAFGTVSPKRELFTEVKTKPRLLMPSKLLANKCNECPNQMSGLLSAPKRFSDESEESTERPNKELSPLYKRIKKENNNCLLMDSKQFIKQELDTELDFNSRQPFVGLFSKLSLDRTCMPAPESSNSYPLSTSSPHLEANDLSEVLKQLNICHKSNQNTSSPLNSKSKKKKNKKAKKSRERKIKVTKNVFKNVYPNKLKTKSMSLSNKKEPKGQYLFKIQSSVIKELKVSATGGLTAEEVQALVALKNEGIVRKRRKHCKCVVPMFKCLLCAHRFQDLISAEEHITSVSHLRHKEEQTFSKIDSAMALDLGQCQDIEKLLSRRRVLAQMSNKTKDLLISKGIRVKDGFGSQAFVCVDCRNESFDCLDAVYDHINTKSGLLDGLNGISLESDPNPCDNSEAVLQPKPVVKKQLFSDYSSDQLIRLFEKEGITKRIHKNSRRKRLKYWCGLCKKYRSSDYQMFEHLSDWLHTKSKQKAALKSQSIAQ